MSDSFANMDRGAPSKEHINKKKEHFLIQCVCIGCEPVFFLSDQADGKEKEGCH